jgi:SAM-dependent methyltransferase
MAVLDRIFAAVYDRALAPTEAAGLAAMREQVLAGLSGTVVEIGAGTGLNLPHYPPRVHRIIASEPEPFMADHLRDRARGDERVEVTRAPGRALPLEDASVDHAVSTLVLCTVDDLDSTVAELARVVRPGGSLALIEHVASDHRAVHVTQRVIQPVWSVFARGCQLTRDPVDALERHGFDTSALKTWQLPDAPHVIRRTRVGRAILRQTPASTPSSGSGTRSSSSASTNRRA